MDIAGVPSPKINWESPNVPGEWKKLRQHVELMFTGPLWSKNQAEKCSYLLLWVGEKGRDIFNKWALTEDEAKELKTYYERFKEYVMPKKNTIFARYKFNEKVQGANETLEQFATELKLLVKECDCANEEEMVRDRIVFGIHSPKVREKLLSVGSELTLDKAMDIARSHELALAQMQIARRAGMVAHATRLYTRCTSGGTQRRKEREEPATARRGRPQSLMAQAKHKAKTVDTVETDSNHCPARGKQCAKCGK